MASKSVGGHVHGLFATNRTDNWWLGPALTVLGLGFFILYNTWAGWQAEYYSAGPYLSPAYAPLLFVFEGARGAAPAAPLRPDSAQEEPWSPAARSQRPRCGHAPGAGGTIGSRRAMESDPDGYTLRCLPEGTIPAKSAGSGASIV